VQLFTASTPAYMNRRCRSACRCSEAARGRIGRVSRRSHSS
jgi:hypothetical protein